MQSSAWYLKKGFKAIYLISNFVSIKSKCLSKSQQEREREQQQQRRLRRRQEGIKNDFYLMTIIASFKWMVGSEDEPDSTKHLNRFGDNNFLLFYLIKGETWRTWAVVNLTNALQSYLMTPELYIKRIYRDVI